MVILRVTSILGGQNEDKGMMCSIILYAITFTAFDHHALKCRSEGNQLGDQDVSYKKEMMLIITRFTPS
jgi:hypothetical protein